MDGGTSPTATRCGGVATRSVVLGNIGDPSRRRGCARTVDRYRARRRSRSCASTPTGPPRGWRRTHEAPARHQRLPTQDRRHPVAAVGVVAAAAARPVRGAHQPVRRGRRVRRRPAVRRRARAGTGAAAAPDHGAPGGRARPALRRRARRARSGGAARPDRPVARRCRTTSCCTAPRSPCRVAYPAASRRSPTCCATPAT